MNPKELYDILHHVFGPQHWWPADSPFEIIVGAILTQQTSWSNVEKAIANLKAANVLAPDKIAGMPLEYLEDIIRPSGFYRQKARYLKALCRHIVNAYSGNIDVMFSRPLADLIPELLALPGIGPETADSILLYAGGKPTFVVDAYTIRICQRIGINDSAKYDEVKEFFESNLPKDILLYNEFHALFVRLGKDLCRPKAPKCGECPVKDRCLHVRTGT
jgi:endonuclease-3 related protein